MTSNNKGNIHITVRFICPRKTEFMSNKWKISTSEQNEFEFHTGKVGWTSNLELGFQDGCPWVLRSKLKPWRWYFFLHILCLWPPSRRLYVSQLFSLDYKMGSWCQHFQHCDANIANTANVANSYLELNDNCTIL